MRKWVSLLMLLAWISIATWGCGGGGGQSKDDWDPPWPKQKQKDDGGKKDASAKATQ